MTNININAVKTLLKKVAKKRPILGCISYQDDKIVFTDSYSLIEIKEQNKQIFNLNMFTGRLLEGQYPNIDRVKPREHALEPAKSLHVEIRNGKGFYIIDGYLFDRKQVDRTFKTVGINFEKHIRVDDIKLYKNSPKTIAHLVYEKDDLYILILGLLV